MTDEATQGRDATGESMSVLFITKKHAFAKRILRAKPDNLYAHAEHELELAFPFELNTDDPASNWNDAVKDAALEKVLAFSVQDHSGASAGMTTSIVERLMRFEPLTPLTGEDDEWMETGPGLFQNKRCSHVFRQDGKAYDIQGRVFRDPSGATFTSVKSRVDVEFPYTPSVEYLDVDDEGDVIEKDDTGEDLDFILDDDDDDFILDDDDKKEIPKDIDPQATIGYDPDGKEARYLLALAREEILSLRKRLEQANVRASAYDTIQKIVGVFTNLSEGGYMVEDTTWRISKYLDGEKNNGIAPKSAFDDITRD